MFFKKNKKNKKMKWWLTFGTISSTLVVTATVVSCSATSPATPIDKTMTTISNIDLNSQVLNSPLKVLNKTNQLTNINLPKGTNQEFILAKYYYSGRINNTSNGYSLVNGSSNPIMMAPSDSLVLVFNNNSNTLTQMESYINTLYFNDTSIGSWALQNQTGVINSNNINGNGGGYIKFNFNNSELENSYYGSQTNHLLNPPNFGTWLEQIESYYKSNPKIWQQLLNYYGYMKNSNGKFVSNPSIANPSSSEFYPLGIIPQNLWIIKQIANNAFAFTYNANIEQVPSITYANISQILTNVTGNSSINEQNPQITQLTPALSLGTSYEWNFYANEQVLGSKLTEETPEPTSGPEVAINPNFIINYNEQNGIVYPLIYSYIKYLTSDITPTIAILVNTNLANNIMEKY